MYRQRSRGQPLSTLTPAIAFLTALLASLLILPANRARAQPKFDYSPPKAVDRAAFDSFQKNPMWAIAPNAGTCDSFGQGVLSIAQARDQGVPQSQVKEQLHQGMAPHQQAENDPKGDPMPNSLGPKKLEQATDDLIDTVYTFKNLSAEKLHNAELYACHLYLEQKWKAYPGTTW
jgi:hypothetical protein